MKKSPLFPIFFTVFIDLIGVGIVIPILARLFLDADHGVMPGHVPESVRTITLGFLIASYPLAQFFGAPILGTLSDRFGRKKILIVSLIGTFIGYLLFASGIILKHLYLLFFSRILDGFTGGNISIAMSAIADISDAKSKAKNFGLIGMAFGLGFILGPYFGGKLSDPHLIGWFNYSTPFLFAALLCLINIGLVVIRFRETLTSRNQARKINVFMGFKNLAKAWRMIHLRTMFIVVFFLTFGFNFFTQFFQVFLIDKFHYTQSQIGDLFGYIGLWIAATQGILIRSLAKKYAPPQILIWSCFCLAMVFPLLLIPYKAYMLYFILPFISIFQGLSHPNSTAIISNLADKNIQGEILGINQSIQSLGMSLPPIIAGFIVSLNRNLPILVAGAMTLLAWLIFVIFFFNKNKGKLTISG